MINLATQAPTDEQLRKEVFDALWKRRLTVAEVREEIETKYGRKLSNTFLYSVRADVDREHTFAKSSRQIYSVEEKENAEAIHAFDDFKEQTDAKNNAEVITKLKPVMPIAQKVDEILKRSKSEKVKQALQEFLRKKLAEIDADVGVIIENFEHDASKLFKINEEEEESHT